MSKPVRLPDYLAAEVQHLADLEKRSLANMVKVLLEQALRIEGSGAASRRTTESKSQSTVASAPEDHFRPDPKK